VTATAPRERAGVARSDCRIFEATRRLDVAAEQFCCTGLQDGPFLAMMALVEPAMKCSIPILVSDLSVVRSRLGAIAVPFGLEEKNKFQPDIREIAQKISPRTRMIIFNSPNNPTGNGLQRRGPRGNREARREARSLGSFRRNLRGGFCSAANTNHSNMPDMADRTVIIDGFSKSFAMTMAAGIRGRAGRR